MHKTQLTYFEDEDILHVLLSEEPETGSIEISPDITAEINAQGELIGVEILHASLFIRDVIMDSVQARVLQLAELQAA